jgi:hypothetical protein
VCNKHLTCGHAVLAGKQTAVPGYVIEHQNVDPLENVHCVYSFALLRGTTPAHVFFPTANQWISYRQDEVSALPMTAAQLLMLATENDKLGAPFVDVSKNGNRKKYDQVIAAYARCQSGIGKKQDKALVDTYITGHYAFSTEMQRDLESAMSDLVAAAKNKKAAAAPAAAAAVAVDADEAAVEEAAAVVDDAPVDILDQIGPFIVNGLEPGDAFGGHPTPGTLFEHMTAKQLNPAELAIFSDPDSDEEQEEDAAAEEDDDDDHPKGQWFNKVHMTLTPIEKLGYLLQFHVRDKTWNPGTEIMKIIREEMRRHVGTNRFYSDPYEVYSIFKGTGFPSHGFTKDKYVRLCQSFFPAGKWDSKYQRLSSFL